MLLVRRAANAACLTAQLNACPSHLEHCCYHSAFPPPREIQVIQIQKSEIQYRSVPSLHPPINRLIMTKIDHLIIMAQLANNNSRILCRETGILQSRGEQL
jgi:hypothetical protein